MNSGGAVGGEDGVAGDADAAGDGVYSNRMNGGGERRGF